MKRALFGAQEQHGLGQLLGLAHPPDRKQLPSLLGADVLLLHPLVEDVARGVDPAQAQMALTLIYTLATSSATVLVEPSTPPLEAA